MRYVHGIDGKWYPVGLSKDDREYVIGRCHYLRHDEGLSVRQIKARIEAETTLKRSVGSIAAYLKIECVMCSGGQITHLNTPGSGVA